jgi:enhancing lycopene biosynthesis protein 2
LCLNINLLYDTHVDSLSYAGTVGAVKAVGATHIPKNLNEAHVDEKNKVVTAPAYMCGTAPIHKVAESCEIMVDKLMDMA